MDKNSSLVILRSILRMRMVEEAIASKYNEGKMRCPVHLSIGQEAVPAVVSYFLKDEDLAVSGHRAHAHYLAKGSSLNAMLAEIYGKSTGCAQGRGGSMHLIDESKGFVGSTAIVGGTVPIGVGLALALKHKNKKNLACIYLGDGAMEEGVVYESLNFAALKKLPCLFVCENNFFSVYSPLKVRQPEGRRLTNLVDSIGIKSVLIDGNSVEELYSCLGPIISSVRNGEGPVFLECPTYRWREHCGPNFDNDLGYRSVEEYNQWKRRDPVETFKTYLIESNQIQSEDFDSLENEIENEIKLAFEFAENSTPAFLENPENEIFSKIGSFS